MTASDILERARTGDVLTAYRLARSAQLENPGDPNYLLMRAVYAAASGMREDCIAILKAVPDILSHPMARMWGINALVLNLEWDRLRSLDLIVLPEAEAELLALEPDLVLQIGLGVHLLLADPNSDREVVRAISSRLMRYSVARDSAQLALLAGQAMLKLDGPEGLTDWCRTCAKDHVIDPLLDMLLPECYRADPPQFEAALQAVSTRPTGQIFPTFGAVPRITHRRPLPMTEILPNAGSTPEISVPVLVTSMRRLKVIIENWAKQPGSLQDWVKSVSDEKSAPLLVASTGRVGTTAIASVLRRAVGLLPFHYLNNQPNIPEQNRLLYMLLNGILPKDAVIRLMEDWLQTRRAEIDIARFSKRRAVIVNHLDTIFAPLLLSCFPEARVIHVKRDARKTFLSLGYKNQFGYTQLRHFRHTLDPDTATFGAVRDEALTHDEEVIWYMAVTQAVVDALKSVWGDETVTTIDMEKVFKGDPSEHAMFRQAFGLDESLTGTVQTTFGNKVNEKAFFALAPGIEKQVEDNGLFEDTWAKVSSLPLP